jgi:hypothetical protein
MTLETSRLQDAQDLTSQQHSQEEKFCGGFLSPGLPDDPIMSRDDSIEPFHSQGCDQGL